MKLEQTNYDNSETGCCARLNTESWNEKEFIWHDKLFLKDHIREFMHLPLNFGSVISRDHEAIEEAGAYPEDPLWLTDEVSPWGADIYVAVDREIPGQDIEKLSGTFLSKVFEGPYRDAGKMMDRMEEYVRSKQKEPGRIFSYYATCPKCSKIFGENQIVLFAEVE